MKPTQFKDINGKTWDCKINLGKTLLIDRSDFTVFTDQPIILSRYDQDSLKIIFTNPAVMFAVIGILVRNDCKDNFEFEIKTDEDEELFQQKFVASIEGPIMEPARNALMEAISDFFPAAKIVLSTFLMKLDEFSEKASKRLTTEILPMLDQEMDSLLDDEINSLKKKLQMKAKEVSSP